MAKNNGEKVKYSKTHHKPYPTLPIVVGMSVMWTGGHTSVCGLSFVQSRDGTARILLKNVLWRS